MQCALSQPDKDPDFPLSKLKTSGNGYLKPAQPEIWSDILYMYVYLCMFVLFGVRMMRFS